ncbi:MAG: hypothetical protein IPG71_02035 [bacterium]|nr:hypothetical protein [bacterium]
MNSPTPPDYLNAEQLELFEKLADKVVGLGFALPAVLSLETMRSMNFIGSQVMIFFAPMVKAFFTAREYDLLQQALERRETIGFLTDLIEAKDEAARAKQKAQSARLKAEKSAAREAKRKR